MKERLYYIDYAKALGMLLIMAAHTFVWFLVTLFLAEMIFVSIRKVQNERILIGSAILFELMAFMPWTVAGGILLCDYCC